MTSPSKGFDYNNCGEDIDKTVALLHKGQTKQTKSRPRKSNESALAEG